jgi:hypothetical protein
MIPTLFYVSWIAQAMFAACALTFAIDIERTPAQRFIPAAAAALAFDCSLVFLLNQRFFCNPVANLVLSVIALLLFSSSLIVYWRGGSSIEELFRAVNFSAFLLALLSFAATPRNLFLTFVFIPSREVVTFHLQLVAGYVFISGATLFLLGYLGRRKPLHARRIPPCRRAPPLIIGALGAVLATSLYFSSAVQTLMPAHKHLHADKLAEAPRDSAVP